MLDLLAALARFALYAGLLYSAGASLACASLSRPEGPILLRRTIRLGAALAIIATLVSTPVLLARLGGALDGPTLSAVFMAPPGLAAALQPVGACGLLVGSYLVGAVAPAVRFLGALVALASFAVNGHSAASGVLPGLAALVHVLLAAWWVGALLVLSGALRTPAAPVVAGLLQRFTAQATVLVIVLVLAGAALLATLIDFQLSRLVSPYGAAFAAKLSLVAVLAGIVTVNRFRFAPRIARGEAAAAAALGRSVRLELVVILCVLAVTAGLTTWTSPHA